MSVSMLTKYLMRPYDNPSRWVGSWYRMQLFILNCDLVYDSESKMKLRTFTRWHLRKIKALESKEERSAGTKCIFSLESKGWPLPRQSGVLAVSVLKIDCCSLSSSSRATPEMPWPIRSLASTGTHWRLESPLATCCGIACVPCINLTKAWLVDSKLKQEKTRRGPASRTHWGKWRRSWTLALKYRSEYKTGNILIDEMI